MFEHLVNNLVYIDVYCMPGGFSQLGGRRRLALATLAVVVVSSCNTLFVTVACSAVTSPRGFCTVGLSEGVPIPH